MCLLRHIARCSVVYNTIALQWLKFKLPIPITMQKGETKGELGFQHIIRTRVNTAKYRELTAILEKTKDENLCSLVRKILDNQKIRTYTYDESLNIVMEELAALRQEIRAIGININQITRLFNTYPEDKKKEFFAKVAFKEYLRIESKINRLLDIISELSKKWLSESK